MVKGLKFIFIIHVLLEICKRKHVFAQDLPPEMARNLFGNKNRVNSNFMTMQFGYSNNYLDTAIIVPRLCIVKTPGAKKASLVSYKAFSNDYWSFWSVFKVNFTTSSQHDQVINHLKENEVKDGLSTGRNSSIAYFLHSFYHNNMHHFLMDNAISLHTIMQSMGHVTDESNNALFLAFPDIGKRTRWLEPFWKAININTSFNRFYDYNSLDEPFVCFHKAVFAFTKHTPMSPTKVWNVSTCCYYMKNLHIVGTFGFGSSILPDHRRASLDWPKY